MSQSNKVYVRRKKRKNQNNVDRFMENLESWVAYWRANPHRFITDYLGLKLYDFQKILIYQMNMYPNFIFIASRGLAKSTLGLLFAIQRCILYPDQKVVIVAPTKRQSKNFVKKVNEFMRDSINLKNEVSDVKVRDEESAIYFHNGSEIITVPYSENALGIRAHILIVDEFVRTEQAVLTRVFVPFLTNTRMPPYNDLTEEEKLAVPEEPNRQLYLSSIRRADEWSYAYFKTYVKQIEKGSPDYTTVALPYNFGVKNRFINRKTVEQSFRENTDSREMLLAEYKCIPEKSTGNSFFAYNTINKRRTMERALVCMSDEEYITYRNNRENYPYYVPKFDNEIRILSMDVALMPSARNDNTAFWILSLIPDGGKYKRMFIYAESMHGENAILQMKRAKQLFYEFDCDHFVIDANGLGQPVYDICTEETYDDQRGETYPAWTVADPNDIKNRERTISKSAVPVVWCVKTSPAEKSIMLTDSREILATDLVSFLVDADEARDYINKYYEYYRLEDEQLKNRILNPYVQTTLFVNEATNLEQIIVQGRLSAKEKSGRRKDRVMSYVYALGLAQQLEFDLYNNNDYNILDYIIVG